MNKTLKLYGFVRSPIRQIFVFILSICLVLGGMILLHIEFLNGFTLIVYMTLVFIIIALVKALIIVRVIGILDYNYNGIVISENQQVKEEFKWDSIREARLFTHKKYPLIELFGRLGGVVKMYNPNRKFRHRESWDRIEIDGMTFYIMIICKEDINILLELKKVCDRQLIKFNHTFIPS